ncbi:hypothetical protein H0E87_012024, partial [Populus deltoides]
RWSDNICIINLKLRGYLIQLDGSGSIAIGVSCYCSVNVFLASLNAPAIASRDGVRMLVAQYASDAGNGNAAFNNVDQCLSALEELDSLLLRASRNEPDASVKSMKAKVGIALAAMESLLQTVPSDVLDKGKAVADAYRTPDEDSEAEILDPELKRLESIL